MFTMEEEKQRVLELASRLKRKRSSGLLPTGKCPGKRVKSGDGSCISAWNAALPAAAAGEEIADSGDEQLLLELQRSSKEYADVAELFTQGLGVLRRDTSIQGIAKVLSPGDGYRMEQEFEKQLLKMVDRSGDANVRWAWYGADELEVDAILKHGFGMAVPGSLGYCFAPLECSRISAVQAKEDHLGEQRLILCQVILGKVGLMNPGHDESSDTSVFSLSNPKNLFIAPSKFEPARVLAHHAIRFKLSDQWKEIMKATAISRRTLTQSVKLNRRKVSANQQVASCKIMSFPTLFRILQSRIPEGDLSQLQQSYYHFKSGRLSKADLIHEVRETVSDKLLYRCMSIIKHWSQRPEN